MKNKFLLLGMLAVVGMLSTALTAQLSGTYTIANGNPNGVFDYGDIGTAFDALEANGMSGPVTLEIYDDGGQFTTTTSYGLLGTSVTGLGSANPLTIIAPGSENPVISGTAQVDVGFSGVSASMGFRETSYVTIDGLELVGGADAGLWVYGNSANPASNITVRNCKVHGVTGHSGIAVYNDTGGTLANTTIENNIIWNCAGGAAPYTSFLVGVLGIRRADATTVVRHNTVIHNNGANGAFGYLGGSGGVNTFTFEHNIFACSISGAPVLNIATGFDPVNANYNIYYETGGAIFHSNTTAYASGFSDWQTAGFDANGQNADPLLVNTTLGNEDGHLQGASPAIDGATGSTSTTDFERETRATPDIGADEVVAGAIPTISTTAGTSAAVGLQYVYFINVLNNGSATALSLGTGAPAWLTLSGNVLFGTPAAGDIGVNGPFDLIATNSTGASSESITITVTNPAPEIDITDPNSAAVASGGTVTYVGSVAGAAISTATFTITNSGTLDLTISASGTSGDVNGVSNMSTSPAATVTAGNTTTFEVDFTPTAAGAWSTLITITNNDTDEGTYTITLSGTAQASAAPEIGITSPTPTDLTDGGSETVLNTGTSLFTRQYTIRNEGAQALNLTGTAGSEVVISLTTNCTVTVTQPANSTLAAASGSATTEVFVLNITPTAAGAFSFDVTIANDDLDEGPFNWTFNGNTAAPGGGGGGGGGGSDGGGCASSTTGSNLWLVMLGLLGLAAVIRTRRKVA